jgi:hypothetical protein
MARTKNEYRHLIDIYEQRRADVEKQLKEATQAYIERRRRMSLKIKVWKRAIRRIEHREKRVRDLANSVRDFTGIGVRYSFPSVGRKMVEARGLFYKYGLESGLRAKDLAAYTGCKGVGTPSRCRRTFTRNMVSSPKLRDLWDRFKIYMKDSK